jgi:hypothetical protein
MYIVSKNYIHSSMNHYTFDALWDRFEKKFKSKRLKCPVCMRTVTNAKWVIKDHIETFHEETQQETVRIKDGNRNYFEGNEGELQPLKIRNYDGTIMVSPYYKFHKGTQQIISASIGTIMKNHNTNYTSRDDPYIFLHKHDAMKVYRKDIIEWNK